jgi:radical SAM superfamily enzyme YgiQ (UPF0313 family)
MKRAGCHMLRIGVESGSQKVLNKIEKGITLQQIEETFYYLNNLKMDSHAHLMIACPDDTEQTVKETINFILKINPTIITMGICTPYPGTELFEIVKEKYPEINDGSQCNLSNLHTQGFYNSVFCYIPSERLPKLLRKVYKKFYLRPSYIVKWLKKINNLPELRRVTLAGTTVFDFILRGE